MKVKQLEAMTETLGLHHLRGREQFRSAEAELRVLAAALRPLARAFGVQPGADADERFHADLFGNREYVAKFFQLLHDHDDALAELDAEQRHPDEAGVLVAVADDQAAHLVLQGETGEQLRLAADFETEVELLARVEDLLHDFAQLVHFDRKHAAILALKIELLDRRAEGEVDGLDPMAKDVLETNQQRELQTARLRLLRYVADFDARAVLLKRAGHDMSGFVDVEVFRSPARDVVQVSRSLDAPGRRGGGGFSDRHFANVRTIRRRPWIATGVSRYLRAETVADTLDDLLRSAEQVTQGGFEFSKAELKACFQKS